MNHATTPAPKPDAWVRERRDALAAQNIQIDHQRPWGLALSGGGIRSATFCFGLLKGLASKDLFHKFDLMSTVSGGGYIGSTVGKLFHNAGDAKGAKDVVEALKDADTRIFSSWLRANGRYLIPDGAKDLFFAAASYGRNLLGVHFEIALLALILGGVLVGADLLAWQWADTVFLKTQASGGRTLGSQLLGTVDGLPAIWLLMPLVAWFGALFAAAFWSTPKRISNPLDLPWRPLSTLVFAAMLWFLVADNLKFFARGETGDTAEGAIKWPLLVVVALVLAAAVIGHVLAVVLSLWSKDADWTRNRLTAGLSFVLSAGIGMLVLGVVDYLAWLLAHTDGAKQGVLGAVLVALAAGLRVALPKIGTLPRGLTPGFRGALMSVVNVAGLLLLFAVSVFWISLEHRAVSAVLFDDRAKILRFDLAWAWLAYLALPALALVLVSSTNREFLNRSSLHSFYRARLVRSYLGAGNPHRFASGATPQANTSSRVRDVAAISRVDSVNPFDDLPMTGYAPHQAGGPVHLVNVCVNQTSDPTGGLFNQDRKGLLMTIGPGATTCVGAQGWVKADAESALTLGSWVAISGAAVSPGLGASTRPGVSAILMLAGLRLGYWWDSGKSSAKPGRSKYGQLLDELSGRFSGLARRDWFLSDGGHFENTAAYALLREECEVIVVADCGADPRYAFGDLENLVRKARIDLQAEITFLRPKAPGAAHKAFGSLNEIASEESEACIALARVDYRNSNQQGWMFIVKPNLSQGLPVDLVNFKADNPLFPQEPTTDQFFSEAQWESYSQLGEILGSHLDDGQLRAAAAFAALNFVDDDGTVLVRNAAGAVVARPPHKRISSRIASTGAVTATIGLGGVVSLGVAAWQGVSTELKARALATKIDPAAYKELTEIFGKLPTQDLPGPATAASATVSNRLAPGVAEPRLAEMATALLRVGDAACTPDNLNAFRYSTLMTLMIDRTKSACLASVPMHPSCELLLKGNGVSKCLQAEPSVSCVPMYWGRNYPTESSGDINCWDPAAAAATQATSAPVAVQVDSGSPNASRARTTTTPARQAAGPVAGAPASAPAGASTAGAAAPVPAAVCAGQTIYVKIYGPEMRDTARLLRAPWRDLGASVPPIDDVWDAARSAGRRLPQPYSVPTVLYRNHQSQRCAQALEPRGASPSWAVRPLQAESDLKSSVIEVWVPSVQGSAVPDAAICYQEDEGSPGPVRFTARCFATETECQESRGRDSRREVTACRSVPLGQFANKLKPGWSRDSWFLQQPAPAPEPMPQLPSVRQSS